VIAKKPLKSLITASTKLLHAHVVVLYWKFT